MDIVRNKQKLIDSGIKTGLQFGKYDYLDSNGDVSHTVLENNGIVTMANGKKFDEMTGEGIGDNKDYIICAITEKSFYKNVSDRTPAEGDILSMKDGKRIVLGVHGKVFHISEAFDHDRFEQSLTIKQLIEDSAKIETRKKVALIPSLSLILIAGLNPDFVELI